MVNDFPTTLVYENLASELRRGLLVLAVLAECDVPQYGYLLKQSLSQRGLDIPEGTLYPLLRRLEEQGLLVSQWQLADESRPRRYYQISAQGQTALAQLTSEWHHLSRSLNDLLSPKE
ncbi:MAG: PadR family transcriptional regulator [Caldilineales bacterium]